MRKSLTLAAIIGPALLVGCSQLQTEDNAKQITLEQAPAAVQATIRQQAAGGQITEVEIETENGKTIYTADVTQGGMKYDVEVEADGKLISKKIDTEDMQQGDQGGDQEKD